MTNLLEISGVEAIEVGVSLRDHLRLFNRLERFKALLKAPSLGSHAVMSRLEPIDAHRDPLDSGVSHTPRELRCDSPASSGDNGDDASVLEPPRDGEEALVEVRLTTDQHDLSGP